MRQFWSKPLRLAVCASAALLIGSGMAAAAPFTIGTSLIQSIASSAPFPATSGTHFHSALGAPVEVGSFTFLPLEEEVRGVAEFNLAAQPASSSTFLAFNVNELGSSYFGQTGPGNYMISVIAYAGDNAINLSDFSAPSLGTVGSFSSAGLVLGQTLTFNVSALYTSLLGGSIGFRLAPTTNPGNNVANQFSAFRLTGDSVAVPEPGSVLLLGFGVLALVRRCRSRQ